MSQKRNPFTDLFGELIGIALLVGAGLAVVLGGIGYFIYWLVTTAP